MIRLLDVTVAVLALLLLSPLLIVIAVAVRFTSEGPAIFRQERIGKDLRPFSLLKFRTMRPAVSDEPHRAYVRALLESRPPAPAQPAGLYKLTVDDRITDFGRFLRLWSLDELPQLFNVIVGDMSLVGPRPVIGYELELYPHEYLRRFLVKPGLTGLWQVSGRNHRTYDEMVHFDVEFVERYSLGLHIRILAKTLPVVLSRRGVA